jgi:pyruvate/2-oxoglutarate/acetoin dehydrogenase E1 component
VRELLYRDAIREAIIEEMERDEKVFLIGEDIGIYGEAFRAYSGLLEKFGAARVIDTPIYKNAIMGASIGAALVGYKDRILKVIKEII